MSALLQAIIRLLLPLLREWWKKKNWSAHSIKNLKEIHILFVAGLIQFALFLYVVDHGLEVFINYSERIHQAELGGGQIEVVKAENARLVANNSSLTDQLTTAQDLIRRLIENNPSLAPKTKVTTNPSVPVQDKLDKLKQKYGGDNAQKDTNSPSGPGPGY